MPKKSFRLSNATNLDGLHRRPQYDELIGMIDKPLITHYPNRKATQLRNSNWLQQLDGDDYHSLHQLNANMIKDKEKDILLRHYAQAHGMPLQEVKSMHKQTHDAGTGPTTSYHDMSASDEDAIPADMDAENTPFQHMFDPAVDINYENVHKTVARQPMRSKTLNRIHKETGHLGKVNTNRKQKMTDDDMDDEIAKVSKVDITDAEVESLRKTVKKSAFSKFLDQNLQKVKTDVDTKTKKKANFKKKDDSEDEVSKVERAQVSADDIRDVEKAVAATKSKSSSSSSSAPNARKRKADESPEILKEKNTVSQLQIRKNENYDVAVASGAKTEHHGTYGAWNVALGKDKEAYKNQLLLRKIPWNKSMSIPKMINKILEFDRKYKNKIF